MAQLAREYIHIYTFSLLGAHLQKQFPKLLPIHVLTGALASYFDEYLQLYVPSRFFDTNDILLNFVSFLSGVAFTEITSMQEGYKQ
jgi:glycopeptide antibiotics resistance protein